LDLGLWTLDLGLWTPDLDLPIPCLGLDDLPDAAAGIGHVAGVARDDVEMELHHGLAGGRAVIQAEVEGVGRGAEVRGEVLLRPINPGDKASLLGTR